MPSFVKIVEKVVLAGMSSDVEKCFTLQAAGSCGRDLETTGGIIAD